MERSLWVIIGILTLIILALLMKIYLLRKGAKEIADAFADRLATDTNTLIDISTRDFHMRELAAAINEQLRLLRKQRHRYLNGDRELKEAVTNISHDLRTPLTAICGYMDLLERGEKSETVTRYLSLIANRTEALRKLFDRFFTVEAARNATGLGLSIAKTLVEQMGGNITAQLTGQKLSIIIGFSLDETKKHEILQPPV